MSTQNFLPKPSSEELYRLCTASQSADIQKGFELLGNYLFLILRSRLNQNRFDEMFVHDCAQTALENIWKAIAQGKGPDSASTFLGWSVKVASNRCIDRLRYESRRTTEELSREIEDAFVSVDANLETMVTLDEKKIELLTSLRRHPALSEKSKTIVIQGYLFDQTDSELAQLLATKQSNVRVIRHRNLEKLKHDAAFTAQLRA